MPERTGKRTIRMTGDVSVRSAAGIAGSKESQGPLGKYFDKTYSDDMLGQASWEKAESRLQTDAAQIAINKAGLEPGNIDVIFAGDLLNQCISSVFGLRSFGIPYLGQYGACSTMAQTMIMSAIMCDSGACQKAVAVTSLHFCSAAVE